MKVVVDTFKRKKAAMHLDERQSAMLENAYYQVRSPSSSVSYSFEGGVSSLSRLTSVDILQCDPPDRPAIPPKERTPMQLYLRHLFYNVLNRNSSDKVLKLLRKLHWEDPAVRRLPSSHSRTRASR